ncbi:MAG: alpha/beta hydrolase [Azospirillaceae bacterium]|nr:alpha/beta hydrolase [Azospirillaceae bacterium]
MMASAPHAAESTPPEAAPPAVQRPSLAEIRQRFGAPGDKYADLGGVEVRYRDEGKGPVLLLLHGSTSSLNSWDGVVNRLKGRYRIIRYDQPPASLSGPVSDEAAKTIGAPEALVARLLDKLGVDKAAVFGTSSGGTLAYYFAATYPDRVTQLILANTPANSVADAKIKTTPELDVEIARARKIGYQDREYWRVYLSYLYGEPKRLTPATIDYYYGVNMRAPEKNYLALMALTANKQATAEHLAAVKAPVLIIWGMRDPVLTPPSEVALYDYLTGAASRSLVRMDTVGHFPALESPERVADLVDAYLNRDK